MFGLLRRLHSSQWQLSGKIKLRVTNCLLVLTQKLIFEKITYGIQKLNGVCATSYALAKEVFCLNDRTTKL